MNSFYKLPNYLSHFKLCNIQKCDISYNHLAAVIAGIFFKFLLYFPNMSANTGNLSLNVMLVFGKHFLYSIEGEDPYPSASLSLLFSVF